MRERNRGINIRVTEQEKKRIERNAKRCRLTVSEYVRQLAKGYEPRELPGDEIHKTCIEISLLIASCNGQRDEKFKTSLTSQLNDLRSLFLTGGVSNDGNN